MIFWVCLGCDAFARTDEGLKTQLEVLDDIPQQSAPNAYRILFVGDSITRHGSNEVTKQELGWDHVAGMAASSVQTDYVHLLAARIQGTMPTRRVEIYYDSQVSRQPGQGLKEGSFAGKHARLQTLRADFRPHLVVVQLGEHEQSEHGVAAMQESCDELLGFLKALAPGGEVICSGVWAPGDGTKRRDSYATGWSATVESTLRETCLKHGIPFASVREFALDPSCRGWGGGAGVKWHPNDKGMEGYARVLFAAFGKTRAGRAYASPVLPAAQDVLLGGDVGGAYRLGVERLRLEPYDSANFLRADLSHELKRLFTNFSGDMSGRYIEVATLTAAPDGLSPVLKQLLETLPAPRPDGHFGAEVDWSLPLDKPDPLTAVNMPIFWGHSRLLVGLIEAYGATREGRLLQLARGIGDFYVSTADQLLDPAREAEFRASGSYAAGYVTCYFPGIEGLVRLHQITGDERYLQQARRMADAFRAYDRLPVEHSHGNLLVQQALLLLYETTGSRDYLDRVLLRWREVVTGGYLWPTGGLGERLKIGAGYDEGCAMADWLRLNLKLWSLTRDPKFLDAAERLLANEYVWNRFPNGGYGQLDFRGDESGPFVLRPGHYWLEATWCCTLHGLLGLHDLKHHVLAGSPDGILVNFPLDAAARLQAMDETWHVTTVALPSSGDDRRLRITAEPDGKAGATVRVFLRRPDWAAGLTVSDGSGAPIDTVAENGYVRFDLAPRATVTATFTVRPRLEDRRFGLPSVDPSVVSRHAKVVLTSGPELLMVNAENPPTLVVAVGPDGQIVLPPAAGGLRPLVTVGGLGASMEEIDAAIQTGARIDVGSWHATDPSKPRAFVFDVILVPSGSGLGRALLADPSET